MSNHISLDTENKYMNRRKRGKKGGINRKGIDCGYDKYHNRILPISQNINPVQLLSQHRALEGNRDEQKKMMAFIAKETSNIIEIGSYIDRLGQIYNLPTKYSISKRVCCLSENDVKDIQRYNEQQITVKQCDTMKATKSPNTIILNFANATHAGGGFWKGAHAQEEDLHRRSTLLKQLEEQIKKGLLEYPIPEEGVIFSPYVTFFRGTYEEGYKFQKPFKCSVISSAAPNLGSSNVLALLTGKDGIPLKLDKRYYETMKARIRTILRAGRLFQPSADTIVLGAFGCGAFHNPPEQIAQMFKEVLEEASIQNLYRDIIFAIKENPNVIQNSNYEEFKRVLG